MAEMSDLPDLSKEDMAEAVMEGVRNSADEMFVLDEDRVFDAIRRGVCDAMWRMITNATDMPGHDFFDTLKEGIAQGMERVGGHGQK